VQDCHASAAEVKARRLLRIVASDHSVIIRPILRLPNLVLKIYTRKNANSASGVGRSEGTLDRLLTRAAPLLSRDRRERFLANFHYRPGDVHLTGALRSNVCTCPL
jgi:hypothetical protein